MNILEKTFFVAVYKDGRRLPWLTIHPPVYVPLQSLTSMTGLGTSVGVEKVIQDIRGVLLGLQEYCRFGDDYCLITIEKDEATVECGLELFPDFGLPPFEILHLMEEWHEFLKTYEQDEIPGLPYPPPPPKL